MPDREIPYIPPEIMDLLAKFRDGTITPSEKEELLKWLNEKAVKRGVLRAIADAAGFDDREYARLSHALREWRRERQVEPEVKIRKMKVDYLTRWLKENWQEALEAVKRVCVAYYAEMIDMGYYDPDKGKVRFREFIEDAIDFFVRNRDRLAELEEEVEDLRALAATLRDMTEPEMVKLMLMSLYHKFMMKVLELRALGIPVPESLIEDYHRITDEALKTLGVVVPVERVEREG